MVLNTNNPVAGEAIIVLGIAFTEYVTRGINNPAVVEDMSTKAPAVGAAPVALIATSPFVPEAECEG